MKVRNPIRPLRVVHHRTTYLPHVIAIALLWALAMTLDYHDQAAIAQERADDMSAQMAECLRGEWRGRAGDTEIACMPAVTNISTRTKE